MRGIYRSPVNSPHTKASYAELWCFLWFNAWMNGWVSNREADDLRRRRAHYDITVIIISRNTLFAVTAINVVSKDRSAIFVTAHDICGSRYRCDISLVILCVSTSIEFVFFDWPFRFSSLIIPHDFGIMMLGPSRKMCRIIMHTFWTSLKLHHTYLIHRKLLIFQLIPIISYYDTMIYTQRWYLSC